LVCELVQLFDQLYDAESSVTIDLVARLAEIKPFGERPYLMARLQRDLPTYIASANGFSIDHGDEGDFTKGIPSWWKSHASEVDGWSEAARIALAMAPNSAGAKRVFPLLKILFGSNQGTAHSNNTRVSIMLRYSNTKRANKARKRS
jgi:hypothetical protein